METEMELNVENVAAIIEALLFVSEGPLTKGSIREILKEVDAEVMDQAFTHLQEKFSHGRGMTLEEIAGGLQLRTRQEFATWMRRLVRVRPMRLSQPALEVLSVIAYRQPITRAGIEHIRGVDCGGVLRNLMERQLVKMIGKVEEPGRPILYGTTKNFLQVFGLKDLGDLPTLKEFQELSPEESAQLKVIRPLGDEDLAERGMEPGFMDAPEAEE